MRQQGCGFGVAVCSADAAMASSSWVAVCVLLLHGVFLRGLCSGCVPQQQSRHSFLTYFW